MGEIWKPIPKWEKLYMASNLGNIKSIDRIIKYKPFNYFCKRKSRGRILKQMQSQNGYKKVSLTNGKIRKQIFVHSLVLQTFIGSRPKGFDICHNNGNKHDNRLKNLRYDTRSNNHLDKRSHKQKAMY